MTTIRFDSKRDPRLPIKSIHDRAPFAMARLLAPDRPAAQEAIADLWTILKTARVGHAIMPLARPYMNSTLHTVATNELPEEDLEAISRRITGRNMNLYSEQFARWLVRANHIDAKKAAELLIDMLAVEGKESKIVPVICHAMEHGKRELKELLGGALAEHGVEGYKRRLWDDRLLGFVISLFSAPLAGTVLGLGFQDLSQGLSRGNTSLKFGTFFALLSLASAILSLRTFYNYSLITANADAKKESLAPAGATG